MSEQNLLKTFGCFLVRGGVYTIYQPLEWLYKEREYGRPIIYGI